MYYFYILQSLKSTTWLYRGSTKDLRKRLEKHSKGEVRSSKPYRPLKLVYYEAYLSKKVAINREMSVKKSGSVWTPLMKRVKNSLN